MTSDPDGLLPPMRRAHGAHLVPPVVERAAAPFGPGRLVVVEDAGGWMLPVPLTATGNRAAAGDGFAEHVVAAVRTGWTHDRFTTRALAPCPRAAGERSFAPDVDQTNESVVVGEAVVVKWMLHARSGPHPGVEQPAHLRAVGFREVAAPYGALLWDGRLVASVTELLPGAVDGWEWCTALMQDDLAAGRAPTLGWPRELGALTGRMLAALATPSTIVPEPTAIGDATTLAAQARALLAELHAAGDACSGESTDMIEAIVRGLDDIGPTPVQQVHGDWHVGQVLRWRGGLAATDFDGDPVSATTAGAALRPGALDAVAMAQAVDHVGRVVDRRTDGRHHDVLSAWCREAADACWAGCVIALHDAGRGELLDARLRRPLAVRQELHELVYAARHLPRWAYVPQAALAALLA